MRAFELYGTVQGAVSAYDCLNYLTGLSELSTVLALLHNYIEPGRACSYSTSTRLTVMSMYTPTTASALRTTARCSSGATTTRRGPRRNRMDLTMLVRRADGLYERFDDVAVQHCFALSRIERGCRTGRLCRLRIFGGTVFPCRRPTAKRRFSY